MKTYTDIHQGKSVTKSNSFRKMAAVDKQREADPFFFEAVQVRRLSSSLVRARSLVSKFREDILKPFESALTELGGLLQIDSSRLQSFKTTVVNRNFYHLLEDCLNYVDTLCEKAL
mmetsp:Transcript_37655/g.57686  ORF Transcript_37655/g.57686 Transcript_37655/m.57686 type:complete len:116 (+) Transcript_37655:1133-1480(+)